MKVLIVGGGGREHAIAWKLRRERSIDLIAAPGNPGMAQFARCVPIAATDVESLLRFAAEERIGLTVVGPEAPLEAGIADRFAAAGLPIFGPTAAAARIETSKRFAKELMQQAGVPTARASVHRDAAGAKRALAEFEGRVVVKASGLAAGKGVIIAENRGEAERAIDSMLSDHAFGAAGDEILLEEFMDGEELSLFAITDGTEFIPLIGVQDHKRLLDGDVGPNTGGMGACAPASICTDSLVAAVSSRIFAPTLAAMRDAGSEFRGLLYAGLMLTREGPKVVEFNCRFGDPETEAILPLMKSSLLDLLAAVARGESLKGAARPQWAREYAVTTVVASSGYPDSPRKGDPITLPAPARTVHVFHAGTANRGRELVTDGGRVLAITGVAGDLTSAAELSRAHAESVAFAGKQFRRDIGWRELARGA